MHQLQAEEEGAHEASRAAYDQQGRSPLPRASNEAAFASKNLWNLANYYVRQSFIFAHSYLDNAAVYHLVKSSDAYKACLEK